MCDCDGERPEAFNQNTRKARKLHRCGECRGPIRSGDSYEYVSGIWEGDFCTFKTCLQCVELRKWAAKEFKPFCWQFTMLHQNVLDEAWGESALYGVAKDRIQAIRSTRSVAPEVDTEGASTP